MHLLLASPYACSITHTSHLSIPPSVFYQLYYSVAVSNESKTCYYRQNQIIIPAFCLFLTLKPYLLFPIRLLPCSFMFIFLDIGLRVCSDVSRPPYFPPFLAPLQLLPITCVKYKVTYTTIEICLLLQSYFSISTPCIKWPISYPPYSWGYFFIFWVTRQPHKHWFHEKKNDHYIL